MADYAAYSPYTGAGNLALAMGANPNFGGSVGGYGGSTAGPGAPGAYNPQPGDVGTTASNPLNPYGYTVGVGQTPSYGTPFTLPSFGNTMGGGAAFGGTASSAGVGPFGNTIDPQSWNQIAAATRAQQNPNMFAGGTPSMYGGYGGFPGPLAAGGIGGGYGASQSGGGSPWDPQGVAWNIMSGSPNIPPALAQSNLARYGQAFQNFGGWGNPNAGYAASTIAGAESGGNPFAVNQQGSGAQYMNQWMDSRLNNMQNAVGGNYSPEMQAAFAASEILGGRGGQYGPTYQALNNPNANLAQMQSPLIGNFEGLSGDPRQFGADTANAAKWAAALGPPGMTLNRSGYGASPSR
jgi:hypothetical protein